MVLKAHPTDPDKLIFDNKDRIELLNALSAPPQREWQGLTDEEMFDCLAQTDGEAKRLPLGFKWFAEAIEAKLKEKNT
jgi:hypothetical protein